MNQLYQQRKSLEMHENQANETSPEEIKTMIVNAKKAHTEWAALSVKERAVFLRRIKESLVSRADEIASVISTNNGKTRVDAMATEIIPSSIALSYYIKKSNKWLKDKKLGIGNPFFLNKQSKIHRVPFGVIGIITPWNYPFSIPFSEVIMGLIAGNCVILKIADETLSVGEILKEIVESAKLPEGVFNYIECNGPDASKAMLENGIDKLFFTGSVRVGKLLMKKASETLTPLNLELGGNDAMIVCEDANLDRASAGAAWAGFQNAGQSCGGVERIYVQESVYDAFVEKLCERTKLLRVGADYNFKTDIGLMTTDRQVETVRRHIDDALEKGASIAAESNIMEEEKNGRLVPPKVLINVNHDMLVMKEETFGPVLGVMKYRDEKEAISLANDSDLGLTASVWSTDRKKAEKLGKKIHAGAVSINDHLVSHGLAETPWGGFKQSGIGRSHGQIGFNEMTQPQVIIHDYLSFLPKNLWWFPFGESLYKGLCGIPLFLYGSTLKQKVSGLFSILKTLPRVLVK